MRGGKNEDTLRTANKRSHICKGTQDHSGGRVLGARGGGDIHKKRQCNWVLPDT